MKYGGSLDKRVEFKGKMYGLSKVCLTEEHC